MNKPTEIIAERGNVRVRFCGDDGVEGLVQIFSKREAGHFIELSRWDLGDALKALTIVQRGVSEL